jgi:hypothetical protein
MSRHRIRFKLPIFGEGLRLRIGNDLTKQTGACHSPVPLAVGMPRSLSPAATARRLVAPVACSSSHLNQSILWRRRKAFAAR